MINARGTDINPTHVYNSFRPEEKLLVLGLGLFRNETCFHCIEGTKRSHDKHENRMIYNLSDILELKECTLFNMLKPLNEALFIIFSICSILVENVCQFKPKYRYSAFHNRT